MEKYYNIEIKAESETNSLIIRDERTKSVQEIIEFEDSRDFCKFILVIARDMGIGRMEFVSACNDVVDEIENWGNLSGKEAKDE